MKASKNIFIYKCTNILSNVVIKGRSYIILNYYTNTTDNDSIKCYPSLPLVIGLLLLTEMKTETIKVTILYYI